MINIFTLIFPLSHKTNNIYIPLYLDGVGFSYPVTDLRMIIVHIMNDNQPEKSFSTKYVSLVQFISTVQVARDESLSISKQQNI